MPTRTEPKKAPAKKAAAAAPRTAPRTAPTTTPAPDDDKADTIHQEKDNDRTLRDMALEQGGGLPGSNLGPDEGPAITGLKIVPVDRVLQQHDTVLLHTVNPIDGKIENLAEVMRVNGDRTINVQVKLGDGRPHSVNSVKNYLPEDASPWWSWPIE